MPHKNNTKNSNVEQEKAVKREPRFNWNDTKFAIIGIMTLLAVVSIGYSTVIIVLGTDGYSSKVMLVPQALLGVWILVKKFAIKKGE